MGKRLDQRRLQAVLNFIEAHLCSTITVRGLASLVNLSEFHFSRDFKAATGSSPYRYVSLRRLRRAQELLCAGERPLMEIAVACGFVSQASFTRAFSRATGLAPGQYRAQRVS